MKCDAFNDDENEEMQTNAPTSELDVDINGVYSVMVAHLRALPQAGPLPSLVFHLQQIEQDNEHSDELFKPVQEENVGLERIFARVSCGEFAGPAETRLGFIRIAAYCCNRFTEVLPSESETVELMLEDTIA